MTVTLATFMEVLDTSIANVALPHIAGNLSVGAGREHLGADVVSGVERHRAARSAAGSSTLIGRKRFYMTCVALFTAQLVPVRPRAEPRRR